MHHDKCGRLKTIVAQSAQDSLVTTNNVANTACALSTHSHLDEITVNIAVTQSCNLNEAQHQFEVSGNSIISIEGT